MVHYHQHSELFLSGICVLSVLKRHILEFHYSAGYIFRNWVSHFQLLINRIFIFHAKNVQKSGRFIS